MHKRRYVNDNVHGLIRCTNLEALIMGQAVFSRLHGVYQNSAAYLTWPSNRNQRFEHSLGTMKLSGDMLFAAVANADESVRVDFLEDIASEIDSILDSSISQGIIGKYFKKSQQSVRNVIDKWHEARVMESNAMIASVLDKSDELPLPDFSWRLIPGEAAAGKSVAPCYLAVQAVRIAGMLHDVGHPPFSHAVEHSLEVLAKNAESVESASAQTFRSVMTSFEEKDKKTHEAMGDLLVELLFSSVMDGLGDEGPAYAPLRVEYYVVWQLVERILAEVGVVGNIHRVVSSTIDADRLDFVRRDCMSSGLGQESVQYPRFVDGLKLVASNYDASNRPVEYAFALPTKAVDSSEAFLYQRYRNYDTMVWHHRVVKSEALLQRSLTDLGLKALKEQDSSQDRHLPSNISGLWLPFLGVERNGSIANKHIFGQWNDAWLVTTLSGEYIDLCLRAEEGTLSDADELLRGRLAELLHSERHYLSLVKRFGDLEAVTSAFDRALVDLGGDVEKMRATLLSYLGNELGWKSVDDSANEEDVSASARAFLDLLPFNDEKKRRGAKRNPLVMLRKAFYAYQVTVEGPTSYQELVEDAVQSFVDNDLTKDNAVLEHIVMFRKLDTGIDGSVLLYAADGGLTELDTVSNIKDALVLEEESRPPFYVYVRLKDERVLTSEREERIRSSFVDCLGHRLAEWYIGQYDAFTSRAKSYATDKENEVTVDVQDCD